MNVKEITITKNFFPNIIIITIPHRQMSKLAQELMSKPSNKCTKADAQYQLGKYLDHLHDYFSKIPQ